MQVDKLLAEYKSISEQLRGLKESMAQQDDTGTVADAEEDNEGFTSGPSTASKHRSSRKLRFTDLWLKKKRQKKKEPKEQEQKKGKEKVEGGEDNQELQSSADQ